MRVLGLVFVGTSTEAPAEMVTFARDVLGLTSRPGVTDGARFDLPDGSTFAVLGADPSDGPYRTVGFLVDDLDVAVAELRAAGTEVGTPGGDGELRYVHVRAPDGHVYELVERRAGGVAGG